MKTVQRRIVFAVLVLVMILQVGCSIFGAPTADREKDADNDMKQTADEVSADVERIDGADVADELIGTAALGINQFGIDLLGMTDAATENVMISPYSIIQALSMTYAGARGTTRTEMEQVFRNRLGDDIHTALNGLDYQLTHTAQDDFTLNTANSLWGQKNLGFDTRFLQTLAGSYGAGMRLLDFINQPEAGRVTINDWVEEQTEEKITNLMPPGSITTDTRLVLANAVYFKAAWENEFSQYNTTQQPFYTLDGSTYLTDMMNQDEGMGYAAADDWQPTGGWQLAELPYKDPGFVMDVVVPENFPQFMSALTWETLDAILDEIAYTQVDITLPKFTFEWEDGLTGLLAEMGMPTAFTTRADFSAMTQEEKLYISAVQHKTFIQVDEEGTEAAAATGVGMSMTMMPPEPVYFRADRPFLFVIRERESGVMLFIGTVVAP